MYGGEARWQEIGALVEALEIPVVGNGDIRSGEDAFRMHQETGCHGIMMARGTHGAPWLFQQARAALDGDPIPPDPEIAERFRICLRHARNAIAFGGDPEKAAMEFRKHLGWYTKGIPEAKRLRAKLFQVTSLEEMERILYSYLARSLASSEEILETMEQGRP
jgi:tRNA-dihydrouridine synthase